LPKRNLKVRSGETVHHTPLRCFPPHFALHLHLQCTSTPCLYAQKNQRSEANVSTRADARLKDKASRVVKQNVLAQLVEQVGTRKRGNLCTIFCVSLTLASCIDDPPAAAPNTLYHRVF
jgi:hypothetical protein